MSKRVGLASVLLLVVLPLAGCAWVEAPRRFEKLEQEIVFLRGSVPSQGWRGGPIVVLLSQDAEPDEPHTVDFQILYEPGTFWFYARPGSYQLAAFEQARQRRNLSYRPGAPAILYSDGGTLALEAGARLDEIELGEQFSTRVRLGPRFDLSPNSKTARLTRFWRNLGEVVRLDDARLSRDAGRSGLSNPDKFFREVGTGLYFLEPYARYKVPVLFVHGLGGAPVQFESLIQGLDRDHFQPWLLVYPSVVPVGIVARVLNEMMDVLRKRHRFEKVHVVAHSLGGLVARAYIDQHARSSPRHYLSRFVTIATPWGGIDGARLYEGVRVEGDGGARADQLNSDPTTDPQTRGYVSLVDLAPQSGFLDALFHNPLPEQIRFHLVFGWGGSNPLEPGDGVVPLKSSLRSEAQAEAAEQRGFPKTHLGLLESPEVATYLGEVLAAPL